MALRMGEVSESRNRAAGELPLVLVIAEVAELFRCSVRTVERRLAENTFPVLPMREFSRGSRRWRRDEVLRWLERGRR
jgi:hypothetical protein